MNETYYRIRVRYRDEKSVVIADHIKDIETVYKMIVNLDDKTNRKYHIDKVDVNIFSMVTGRLAKQRLEKRT